MNKKWLSFGLLLLITSIGPQCILAQGPPPETSAPPANTGDQKPDSTSDSSTTSAQSPNGLDVIPETRKIKSAGAVSRLNSVRWGPISLGSLEFNEVVDDFHPTGEASTTAAVSVFRAYFVVDKQYRKSRITFQYQPTITVSHGQVDPNFINQNINFDSYYQFNPRWILSYSDHFSFYNNRSRFGDSFLDSDSISSSTQQNGFLDGPQEVLWNSVSVGISYRWTPRTSISVTPNYAYAHTGASLSVPERSSNGFGVTTQITHQLSPNRAIQAHYSAEHSQFSSSFGDTTYHTIGVGYTQQLPDKWGFAVGVGASNASSSDLGRFWTTTGSASLVKAFGTSSVSLAYVRGTSVATDYLTNRYSDRGDLSYSTQWTRRLQTRGGVGYEREVGTTSGIWGKYVTAQVNVKLNLNATFFAYYVRKWQRGDGQQVFTGNRDLASIGIRWDFAQEAH
jgi:hypothetical protein